MNANAESAYIEILTAGLEAVRAAAELGDLDRCRVESEHLHNIPSLLRSENEQRHLNYLATERTAYIEWVLAKKRPDLLAFVDMAYRPHWKTLEHVFDWNLQASE